MNPPRSKHEYLRQLVDAKNRWSRRLTAEERKLGFLGLRNIIKYHRAELELCAPK